MAEHYAICIEPAADLNAINVVFASIVGDALTAGELSVPLNASGDPNDPITDYMCGMPMSDGQLAIFQDLKNNIPALAWPVMGASGSVSEADAITAATNFRIFVGTAETYTSTLATQTRESALGALGLKIAQEEE